MELRCSSCKKILPTECFPLATKKPRGYAWECKECKKKKKDAKQASMTKEEWYLLQRKAYLKSAYGISLDTYNKMVLEHKHKCAICGCDETESHHGLLHVDHCHKTGKVRGLLCQLCNTALGKFKDSEEMLLKAVSYIRKYK